LNTHTHTHTAKRGQTVGRHFCFGGYDWGLLLPTDSKITFYFV